MPITLLPENQEQISIKIAELLSLEDAELRGGSFALRALDEEHVQNLTHSQPEKWPNVLVTLSDKGYILIDGYHRLTAAKRLHLTTLSATCYAFENQNDVIEMAFRANLKHGLRASKQSRGDYAYWLYLTFPTMEQAEIATRTGISQSAVSQAITKRTALVEKAKHHQESTPTILSEQQRRKKTKQVCKQLTQHLNKWIDTINELDENEVESMFRAIWKQADATKRERFERLFLQKDPQSQIAQFKSLNSYQHSQG